jgi:hypothetical protein
VVYQLLAFASGDGLQNVTEILVRWIDIQVFERLEQVAIFGTVKNHLGTRDHFFVAFAPHLLDENCYLHFAARIDLKCAGRFRVIDLEGNIAARFANKPLANMPCRKKFSFATSDYLTAGRLVYQLCRGANRGNAEQNRKGTGRNQVLRKDDMASLKNWAGQTFHHPAQLLQQRATKRIM